MKTLLAGLALLFTLASARAELVTQEIEYEHDGVTLTGYLVYEDRFEGERPGILVVHEWWGHNAYARSRAEQLARLGYTAFALDMYGVDEPATTVERAQALATPFYQDRELMRARAQAGLTVLSGHAKTNADQLAAIGYCMGGTVALELARAGADLDVVVSFHGGLSTPEPADAQNISGRVLVLNGAADQLVPMGERRAFIEEMEAGEVDYQFVEYGGAEHSFTNPAADALGMESVSYDEKADRRSWQAMRTLLGEAFGPMRRRLR